MGPIHDPQRLDDDLPDANRRIAAPSRPAVANPDAEPATGAPASTPAPAPRLFDRLRGELRTRHYSLRTERAYVDWARRYILFHGKRHPRELGAAGVAALSLIHI